MTFLLKYLSSYRKTGLPGFFGWLGCLILLFGGSSPVWSQHAGDLPPIVREGIQVAINVQHIDKEKPADVFTEGDHVRFRFTVTDTTTKKGLPGLYPAAWMSEVNEREYTTSAADCGRKISNFIGGSLLTRPELDLNVFHVLAMNKDNTINVVDPLFGFGGSKLLAQIQLNGTAWDWVVTDDQQRIFISVPEAREISVIRTADWTIVKHIPVNGSPAHLKLQPDEHYLWADYTDSTSHTSGAAAINTATLEVERLIPTGQGPHELAVDDNNRNAFISNAGAGTVTAIDIRSLKRVKTISTGPEPFSIAYSPLAQTLYAVDKTEGSVAVIDGQSHEMVKKEQAEPGLVQIRMAPDGRNAFIVNFQENLVHILDAASNRIVQTADVEANPDQVTFSDELCYVRHWNSETVLMIPLDVIGVEGRPVPVVDFPGGQEPPGKSINPSPAPGIVQAPGATAVLVANYLDQAIYYYMEGMAAPMDNFSNYGKGPRAVMVIDKSIEEQRPGIYEATAKLPKSGTYDLSVFMDSPRFMDCFRMEVQEDPALKLARAEDFYGPLDIDYLDTRKSFSIDDELVVRFRVNDLESQTPVTDLTDVQLMTRNRASTRHRRWQAEATDEEGVYQARLRFSQEDFYFIYVGCPSRGLTFNNPQYMVVQATGKDEDTTPSSERK